MTGYVDAALEHLEQAKDDGDAATRELEPASLFAGFDPADYEDEVQERWGDTQAYAESARRTATYGEAEWKAIKAEADEIVQAFAALAAHGASAGSSEAIALAECYRQHIDRWFYPCSRVMHAQLAQMYTADDRFRANFDKFGDGTAEFIAAAIEANREPA